MIVATFRAVVRDGALAFEDPARLAAWVALAKEQPVQVTLERESSRRSSAQNARYWAGIVPFAQEVFEQRACVPFTAEMAHYALKLAFLGHVEAMVSGEVVLIPKSTTRLSVAEFVAYCDSIERWIEQEFKVRPELLHA